MQPKPVSCPPLIGLDWLSDRRLAGSQTWLRVHTHTHTPHNKGWHVGYPRETKKQHFTHLVNQIITEQSHLHFNGDIILCTHTYILHLLAFTFSYHTVCVLICSFDPLEDFLWSFLQPKITFVSSLEWNRFSWIAVPGRCLCPLGASQLINTFVL